MSRGQPAKYSNVEDLDLAIEEYFESNPRTPTITGLAHFLGFASRQSLYDYEERPEFSYTIKKAVLLIESKHEEMLYSNSATGSIFWLKNRGWKDKTETDITTGGESFNIKDLIKFE